MKSVTIAGAGPAGLSAAYFLSLKGYKIEIIEASEKVGGLASSIHLWGYDLDLGPHSFLSSASEESLYIWKKFGGEMRSFTQKRGMIRNKKLLSFPPKLAELLIYEPIFLISSGLSYLTRNKQLASTNSQQVFQKHFGKFMTDKLFDRYCVKYMGKHASELDPSFASSFTSVRYEDSVKKEAVTTLYPKDGVHTVWKNVEKYLRDKGVKIRTGSKVKSIQSENRSITGIVLSSGETLRSDHYVFSLPLPVLAGMVNDDPEELKQYATKLNFRDTVLVYLRTKDLHLPYHYVTAFDDSITAGRITNFSEWRGDGCGVIAVEFWSGKGDGISGADDDQLVDLAIQSLQMICGLTEEDIFDHKIVKLPCSYPVPDLEAVSALKHIHHYFSGIKNLSLIGRHASYKWDGQDDNIDAAAKLEI